MPQDLQELFALYGDVQMVSDSTGGHAAVIEIKNVPNTTDLKTAKVIIHNLKKLLRESNYEINETLDQSGKHINNVIEISEEGKNYFRCVIKFKTIGNEALFRSKLPESYVLGSLPPIPEEETPPRSPSPKP